jgi:hypothetical protein
MKVFCGASGLNGTALDRRLEQRIGLPPYGTYDAFLEVWVPVAQLRRPCVDQEVTDTACDLRPPLIANANSDNVAWQCPATWPGAGDGEAAQAQWMCATWINRYGNSVAEKNYPWTALGYAYDWGDPSRVGPSEYVAPRGTVVKFHSITPTQAYCDQARH